MDQLFMCTKLPEDIEARENSKQIDKDLKNAKKVQLQYTQSSSFTYLFSDVGISTSLLT